MADLYADDTVLLAEREGKLQRIVDEFDRVCKRKRERGEEGEECGVRVSEKERGRGGGTFLVLFLHSPPLILLLHTLSNSSTML